MDDAWDALLPRLKELTDLGHAIGLMEYDQAVSMPAKGSAARSRAIGTLESLYHQRLTDPEIGRLLDRLEAATALGPDESASVRVLRRNYSIATKVPAALVRELGELRGLAYAAWLEARPAADFSILQPHLERMVELKKQEADAIGWAGERYDALLDMYAPDVTAANVESLFAELVHGLVPLTEKILAAVGEPPEFLSETYDPDQQEAFCQWLVEHVGFDKSGGRLDLSPHPFTMTVGAGDVRQTTKLTPNAICGSIYAALHETGHALYEQGIPERLLDLPAGHVASLGLHESQSRLWENHVGRSRPFCDFILPHLKERFPQQLGSVVPEEFYRGVNHPRRTLIRITADEVTYNLHVALRFELELALFRDELDVADLPDAWDAGMEKHVGIRPPDVSDGVLQDMHWPTGALGYFPTYTIGTLYAAAFYERAVEQLGDLTEELRAGETARLLGWLRENIHQHAYLRSPVDIARDVIGGPLTARPFLDHLRRKYGEIYELSV
ncbi:MAG: carboxypeptidase M32 [Actinomycetota bacterium]